jgi:hypothetical protein
MIRIDDTSALPQQSSVEVEQLLTNVLLRSADAAALANDGLAITVGERWTHSLELGDRVPDSLELGLEWMRELTEVRAPDFPGRLAVIAVLAGLEQIGMQSGDQLVDPLRRRSFPHRVVEVGGCPRHVLAEIVLERGDLFE